MAGRLRASRHTARIVGLELRAILCISKMEINHDDHKEISIVPMWAVRSALERYHITARPITPRGFPLTWQAMLLKKRHMPVFQQEFIQIIRRMHLKEPFADRRGDLVGIDMAKPFQHYDVFNKGRDQSGSVRAQAVES